MKLAGRTKRIQPSVTLGISAQAKAMRAQGIDVIGFGAGEPDFDTPQHIKDAAVRALLEGFTKYTPVGGIEELKEAICHRTHLDRGLHYDPSEVIVSCGAKHAIYNAAMAILDPGDEVLLPSPYWVSYPDIISLAGAKPVVIPTSEKTGFVVHPEQLKEAITPRTKALILNSPSNPTGAIYLKHQLESLAQVVLENDLTVISDDIYDHLIYNDINLGSIASLGPELRRRTIIINGVSKTYSMTGWRIGYALGPSEVIEAMTKIQGQSTSNPTSVAQKAAMEALTGPQECVEQMLREFDRRRRFMVYRLNEMEGISCFDPKGAFYAFVRIDTYLGRSIGGTVIRTPSDLSSYLLNEAKVAVVPGEAFGSDRHIRLSFAVSMDDIEEGLNRIENALKRLE